MLLRKRVIEVTAFLAPHSIFFARRLELARTDEAKRATKKLEDIFRKALFSTKNGLIDFIPGKTINAQEIRDLIAKGADLKTIFYVLLPGRDTPQRFSFLTAATELGDTQSAELLSKAGVS